MARCQCIRKEITTEDIAVCALQVDVLPVLADLLRDRIIVLFAEFRVLAEDQTRQPVDGATDKVREDRAVQAHRIGFRLFARILRQVLRAAFAHDLIATTEIAHHLDSVLLAF